MRKFVLLILFFLPFYCVGQTSMTRPVKESNEIIPEKIKRDFSKYHTKDGKIKPGTIVIVSMKDGSITEAKVMHARNRHVYWLDQKGGGRFGTCHVKFMKIKDLTITRFKEDRQDSHTYQ